MSIHSGSIQWALLSLIDALRSANALDHAITIELHPRDFSEVEQILGRELQYDLEMIDERILMLGSVKIRGALP